MVSPASADRLRECLEFFIKLGYYYQEIGERGRRPGRMEAPVGAGLKPAPTPEKPVATKNSLLTATQFPGISTQGDYSCAEQLPDQE
jgi:hypothetical protein